jgi:hypothetical protein
MDVSVQILTEDVMLFYGKNTKIIIAVTTDLQQGHYNIKMF